MPTQTLDLTSLAVDGVDVPVIEGRLMLTTTDTGRRSWRATALLRSMPKPGPGAALHSIAIATRQGPTLSGRASITLNLSNSKIGYSLAGTGDFEVT